MDADLGMYKPKRIGHLNLVRKYNKIFPYDYENNEKLEEVVKLIKEKGYEVDYNISGLYKEDCKEAYISGYLYELIKKYEKFKDDNTLKYIYNYLNYAKKYFLYAM